jgi:Reverse transcriptase (RNA-dependent DNA polymerase)
VATLSSLRVVVARAVKHSHVTRHLDVATAFLHADSSERVHVEQPEGYEQLGLNG